MPTLSKIYPELDYLGRFVVCAATGTPEQLATLTREDYERYITLVCKLALRID